MSFDDDHDHDTTHGTIIKGLFFVCWQKKMRETNQLSSSSSGVITCKLVAGLQATSIFVSTISITAIALDRYKVIVYPTHQESANGTRSAVLLLASVWIGALLLSLPLFKFREVKHFELRK